MEHLLPVALGVLRKQCGLDFHFLDELCPIVARVGPGVDLWPQAKRRSKQSHLLQPWVPEASPGSNPRQGVRHRDEAPPPPPGVATSSIKETLAKRKHTL